MSGPFRVITSDVVGTAIDFEAGILTAVREAGGEHHDDRTVLEAFAAAEDHAQRTTPELAFGPMLDPIGDAMAARLDLPALAVGDGPGPLRRSAPTWPAFPDAPAALAALRGRVRLVAVTNADVATAHAMARTLGDPYDDVVSAEDVGVNKPDPRVFAYALGRLSTLGLRAEEVLHVAQSQYHDIGVARRLGLATCWVRRRAPEGGFGATPRPADVVTPDREVRSLAELAADPGW